MTKPKPSNGRLYVVATPIGCLEDLSPRALSILEEVSLILAEDTRVTAKLLGALGVSSYLPRLRRFCQHQENDEAVIHGWLTALQKGQNLALVSDAGSPTLADPGFLLIRAALDAGIKVIPIPGPSALTAALSVSGLPANPMIFIGFYPQKSRERQNLIKGLKTFAQNMGQAVTVVGYEAPHRLVEAVQSFDPEAELVLMKELTKVYEQILRGSVDELTKHLEKEPPLGEWVIAFQIFPPVIANTDDNSKDAERMDSEEVKRLVETLQSEGLTHRVISKVVAKVFVLDSRAIYRRYFA